MTRISLRPLAALGVVAAGLLYVGCGRPNPASTTTIKSTSAQTTVAAPEPAAADGAKLLADWPTPAGAVVISGEQGGYLEPCGCTQGQLGGLGRRYDLAERLRAQGLPLALVDLGGLIADPASARGGIEQTKIKFNVALRALTAMKYDAIALSAADLKVGVAETLGQLLNMGDGPKVVAANVEPAQGFEGAIRKSVVTTAGPVKVGITAVLDPETWDALPDPDKAALIPISSPQQALPAVLADLEKRTDVQILLVQGPPERAKALAETFPEFDLVVATSHVADPPDQPESLNGGRTMLISVGKKGKYVGVVGLFPNAEPRFRYKRVTLGPRYKMAEPIAKLLNEDYQDELKAVGVVENISRRVNIKGAPGSTYVGAEACKGCHPNTFNKWASTKHAHAFESITHDPRGNRSADAECISCHTTGFEFVGGWVSPEKTLVLKGNGCENCHGPSSKHVAEPDNLDFRKAIALKAAEADRSGLCLKCHDEDNSPKFDFATYWGKVMHNGLDSYSDPKVHQGKPAAVAGRTAP